MTDDLSTLDRDQAEAWSAVRARLAVEAPWLTAGVFRAVPVAVPADLVPVAACDRWGRVYVNFDAENNRAGIAGLADGVKAATLDWLSGRGPEAGWHAALDDPRFRVVTATDAGAAAQAAAVGVAAASRAGDASLEDWQDWAYKQTGTAQVRWQEALGGAFRAAVTTRRGHQAQTYRRLSRRSSPGVILPARVAHDINIAVIADMSGSVTPDLPHVIAELESIMSAVGVLGGNVTVYGVDDEVVWVADGTRSVPTLAPREGHFTDLRPGFLAAASGRRGVRPDLIIAITDGFTPWPEQTAAPVIVALVGTEPAAKRAVGTMPAWVSTVRVDTTTS